MAFELSGDINVNNRSSEGHSNEVIGKIVLGHEKVGITPVFEAYWRFAAERQKIFFKRVEGANQEILTEDAVLQMFKFTNSYRASDRVSQFLIKNVIYDDKSLMSSEEIFFRVMLFKFFNKIETWQLLEAELGRIELASFNFDTYNQILSDRLQAGERIYSAAYIMPSAGNKFGYKLKHQNHLRLIEFMLDQNYPQRISDAETMSDAYDTLLAVHSIGPFLAYQFITDLNYSPLTDFSETEFVVAGPGALDGISKCFVGSEKLSPGEIITYMASNQDQWFETFDIKFPSLWDRPLQLIDCQNLFCEISKYSRVAFPQIAGMSGRTRIKQKYFPQGRPPQPWYPPKWGLNDKIDKHENNAQTGASQAASAVQYTLL